MKKFYITFLGSLLCLSAQARELTFWMDGRQIKPGETVECNNVSIIEEDTYKEVTMDPKLSISSDIYTSQLTVTATCTSGQDIRMCAGGSCMGGESVTKKNVKVQANQKLNLEFEYIGELDLEEKIPVVTTVFEAQDGTYAETLVQFVLTMCEEGASVSVIEVADEIRPVAGGLQYSLETPARFELHTVGGACVHSAELSGNGTVSAAPGLYIYTIGNKTGKVFIK